MLQEKADAEIQANVQILLMPVRFQVKLKFFRDSGAREGTELVLQGSLTEGGCQEENIAG